MFRHCRPPILSLTIATGVMTCSLVVPGLLVPEALEAEPATPGQQACWQRGQPATVDLIAQQNPEWRERVFSLYELEANSTGWRWTRRAGTGILDSLAPGMPEGMNPESPPTELLVTHGSAGGRGSATHTVTWADGNVDEATFSWSVPPERICEGEVISLEIEASIARAPSVGDPIYREAAFVFDDGDTGSDESLFEVSDACVHRRGTIALGGIDVGTTMGRQASGSCRRTLGPLAQRSQWTLAVNLPEAFQVFYPYHRQ